LKNQKNNFVILDTLLPNEKKLKMVKWIKKNYPLINIIFFTNNSNSLASKTAIHAGVDYFIDK
jgi:response regulator of citrate/malate metabolism